MRSRVFLYLLLAVAFGATPAVGQSGRERPADQVDPVQVILDLHSELDLSADQMKALRKIRDDLQALNRRHVEELVSIQREVRGATFVDAGSGRRGAPTPSDAQLSAAREPMRQIQANTLAAMEQVNAVLRDDQKRRAASLLRLDRRNLDRRRGGWIRFPG